MAACCSRQLYLEFTVSQAMGTFLRCMERALSFFGGVALADIFDNMKTVVVSHAARDGLQPALPRVRPRAQASPWSRATSARRTRRVGSSGPSASCALDSGRVAASPTLLDLNTQAAKWRDDIANHRVHEVTGKVPALVFAHEERRCLQPVPDIPFDVDDVESCGVTKSFRVDFDRNRYSVPWRLVGQTVLVRATDETVAIFLGPKQVAAHRRSWNIGQDIEHPSHRDGLLEHKPAPPLARCPPRSPDSAIPASRTSRPSPPVIARCSARPSDSSSSSRLFGESATAPRSPR
ncbi:MAG: hypothetical protein HS111_04640 [Kofleriaceae bacterium]|nr:hypothetical protein [Kofleriaceae bacterium]